MNFRVSQRQQSRVPTRFTPDTRRWTVMVIVLIGSLGVYAVERWMRKPDAPVSGNAFVADGDTLTISGTRIRLIDIDAPELDQTCTDAQGLNTGPSNVETGSDSSSMGPIIGGAGEQTAPPCNLARARARRPHDGLHRPPPGTQLAAWRSLAHWSAPASTPG